MIKLKSLLESNNKQCFVVLDTNGKIYGVFNNMDLANQWKKDAEKSLGFQGSNARVNIKTSKLYI